MNRNKPFIFIVAFPLTPQHPMYAVRVEGVQWHKGVVPALKRFARQSADPAQSSLQQIRRARNRGEPLCWMYLFQDITFEPEEWSDIVEGKRAKRFGAIEINSTGIRVVRPYPGDRT